MEPARGCSGTRVAGEVLELDYFNLNFRFGTVQRCGFRGTDPRVNASSTDPAPRPPGVPASDLGPQDGSSRLRGLLVSSRFS